MAAASVTVAAPELLESADEDGFTPLHLAVIQGNMPLVTLLLANKANVDALDNEGHSVIHWATGTVQTHTRRPLLCHYSISGSTNGPLTRIRFSFCVFRFIEFFILLLRGIVAASVCGSGSVARPARGWC